jgi:hypothetical protein
VLFAESFWERNSTAITVIVAIAVAAVGWYLLWYFYEKGKERKHLDYRIVSDIPIIANHKTPEELKVVYGPLELQKPRVTEVRFKNTGKQVIGIPDFLQKPYQILPRPGAKLVDFTVVERPSDLVEKLELIVSSENKYYDPDTLLVYPNTLNSDDEFTVQLIYDGGYSSQPPTVKGRIRGETRETTTYQLPDERSLKRSNILMFFGSAGLTVAILMLIETLASHQRIMLFVVTLVIGGLLGIIGALVTHIRTLTQRRQP